MSQSIEMKAAELHNLVIRDGRATVRDGLVTLYTPADGTVIVGAFTVENPRTSEPWHYVFEQVTTTLQVTMRVMTEEYAVVFSVGLGAMTADPVITYGVVNNQVMINSPSFSSPLYGVVGAGLIPAIKTPTSNPDLEALDIPAGHLCAWRDRFVIAAGPVLLVNDGGLDPRTFIAENSVSLPGQILDLFEGPDGALWIFTSRAAYALPVDALSQSQLSVSFLATIPGVETSRPRNAIATTGTTMALGQEGLILVGRQEQVRIDVAPYEGRRYFSPVVEVADYRVEAQIFPTGAGAILGFTSGVLLEVDLRRGFRSYTWNLSTTLALVGVLRSRDGATIIACRAGVFGWHGTVDVETYTVRGVACQRVAVPADSSPVVRFVSVAADNYGADTHVFCSGNASDVTTPTRTGDLVIGTSLWGSATTYSGREMRTTRHALARRAHELELELAIDGARRSATPGDVQARGQGAARRSKSP